MKLFTMIPEALDYVAGQAWLSPAEPAANRAATIRERLEARADYLRAVLRGVEQQLQGMGA